MKIQGRRHRLDLARLDRADPGLDRRQCGDRDRELHADRRFDRQYRRGLVHGRSVPFQISRRHQRERRRGGAAQSQGLRHARRSPCRDDARSAADQRDERQPGEPRRRRSHGVAGRGNADPRRLDAPIEGHRPRLFAIQRYDGTATLRAGKLGIVAKLESTCPQSCVKGSRIWRGSHELGPQPHDSIS